MKQFTLELANDTQRPIVELKSWHAVEALLDTGAHFPVWVKSEAMLQALGGRCIKKELHSAVLVVRQLGICTCYLLCS